MRKKNKIKNQSKKIYEFLLSGELERAESLCHKIIKKDALFSDAWYILSSINQKNNDLQKSLYAINKAIQINPENESYYCQRGYVQTQLNLKEDALKSYRITLEINPCNVFALNNIACHLKESGALDKAISLFEQILKIKPDFAEIHNNYGNALTQIGKIDEAIVHFEKAINLRVDYAAAYHNLGSAMKKYSRLEEAVHFYVKAIEANPNYAEAYDSVGRILIDVGKPEEAIFFLERGIEINPDFLAANFNLMFALQRTCEWEKYEIVNRRVQAKIVDKSNKHLRAFEDPFSNISRIDDVSENYKVAKEWSKPFSMRATNSGVRFSFDNRKMDQRKITIAYLSSNFHDHPNASLVNCIFRLHDREKFNIYCYSCGDDDDSIYRKKIKQECDRFVDLHSTTDVEAANQIYNDEVDILVDFMGYTKGHRIGICALRPAPIQIRYLGMLGTTGSDFFDYLIGDRIVIPSEHLPFYSEKIIYMPDCYIVNSYESVFERQKLSRNEMGLPEEGIVFCSFNQPYKIDPIIFDTWMKILKRVPGSVLWLQGGNAVAEKNLRDEAAKRGIDDNKILFAKRLPRDKHICRLKLADLALDTRIVGGSATTCDALWAGVPVVTLLGNHFNSRMSSSILNAIGLNELIASSIEEYESLCVQIATETAMMKEIRDKLSRNRELKPLFDSSLFLRSLEDAFQKIWYLFQVDMFEKQGKS